MFIILAIYLIVNIVGNSATLQQREFAQLVLEMSYEAKKTTGLPASIVAAQCVLESGYGKHTPKDYKTGEESNNFFGIKAYQNQPYVLSFTWEYDNSANCYYRIVEKFRKYDSLLESLIDYGNFIYENPRYRQAIANRFNPVKYILEIKKAGYATCPDYAEKVLRIAEQCNFLTRNKFDK